MASLPLARLSACALSGALVLSSVIGISAVSAVPSAPTALAEESHAAAFAPRAGNERLLAGTITQIGESLPEVKPIYVGYLGTQSFIPKTVANKKDKRGCNLRQQMLISSATVKPKVGKKCRITGGVWLADGGAKRITKAKLVVLEPAIPYKQAWGQGASQWTPAQRLAWATQVGAPKAKTRAKAVSQLQATQQIYSKEFIDAARKANSAVNNAESENYLYELMCNRGLITLGFAIKYGFEALSFCAQTPESANSNLKKAEAERKTICAAMASRIANTAAWGLSVSATEVAIIEDLGYYCKMWSEFFRLADSAADNNIKPIPSPVVVPSPTAVDTPSSASVGTFNSYPANASGAQGTRQLFGIAAPADWVPPRVPVGYLRLWDAGVSWRQIELAKGQYDWRTMDLTIQRAGSIGASLMYVLGDTPAWANGNQAGNVPPNNLQDAADFISAVCRKYQGSIASYEVWNEGNLSTFWTGSMDQLADLTQKVNGAVKGCFPNSQVFASSTGTRADGAFVRNYPEYLKALESRGWPVDGYTVHTYPAADGGPKERVNELGQFKTLLAQNNAPVKPIMDTELNYGLAGLGQDRRVIDPATGAAYISQSYIQSLQYGVDSLFWFLWTEGDYDKLGIQLHPGTDTTNTAFNTTYQWLVGSTMTRCTFNVGLHACQIRMADGTNATLMWTDSGEVPAAITGLGTRVQSLNGSVVPAPASGVITVGISPVAVL